VDLRPPGAEESIVDVTSIRVQISNPFTQDSDVAGFVMPRLVVSLQYLGDSVLVPGDVGYIDQVDLLINSLIYKPGTATVDTQLETWKQRSMPGGDDFVEPFFLGIDFQGNMPGSYQVDISVFWKVRKGTEIERTFLAVKLSTKIKQVEEG
jgi:hypothetical protein